MSNQMLKVSRGNGVEVESAWTGMSPYIYMYIYIFIFENFGRKSTKMRLTTSIVVKGATCAGKFCFVF